MFEAGESGEEDVEESLAKFPERVTGFDPSDEVNHESWVDSW